MLLNWENIKFTSQASEFLAPSSFLFGVVGKKKLQGGMMYLGRIRETIFFGEGGGVWG